MKIKLPLLEGLAQLSESQGDEMLKQAKALKRDGNLVGYHKQMVKYSEHMADSESYNASRLGQFSPAGRTAMKRVKKFQKAAAEHREAYSAEMDKSSKVSEQTKMSDISEGWFSKSEPVTDKTVKNLNDMFAILRGAINDAEAAIESTDSKKLTKSLQTIVKSGEILQKRFGT